MVRQNPSTGLRKPARQGFESSHSGACRVVPRTHRLDHLSKKCESGARRGAIASQGGRPTPYPLWTRTNSKTICYGSWEPPISWNGFGSVRADLLSIVAPSAVLWRRSVGRDSL
jgi:hypothetical protein